VTSPRARLEFLGSRLGGTHLGRTSVGILGGFVKVSRQAAEHFFQIVLPRRFRQSPSVVRLLAEMRCMVHNHENTACLETNPPPVMASL
jgi:hypothetical protein